VKLTVEYTEAESLAYIALCEKIVDKIGERLFPAFFHDRSEGAPRMEESKAPKAAPAPVPEPTSDLIQKHLNSLGKLSPEQEVAALDTFSTFLQAWLVGWEMPHAPQPGDLPGTVDRVKLMENLGAGASARHILILAFQRLSLQQLVIDALVRIGWHPPFDEHEANLNWIERLAGHLVQLAAPCGFPELVDTYDYTTRWRRTT
jgi:hypothetical protein